MALKRTSSNRFSATIWPGFVDAMTALLMVMMFVITIFVIVQWVLREQITDQDGKIVEQEQSISRQAQQLDRLAQQVSVLGKTLTASEQRSADLEQQLAEQAIAREGLEDRLAEAQEQARDRAAQITRLSGQLESSRAKLANATSRLTDFEAEVAALIAARNDENTQTEATHRELRSQLTEEKNRASAAELAIAAARQEVDAQAEQARLAAARRNALEALIADLRLKNAGAEGEVSKLQSKLSATEARLGEAEAERLVEAEAAKALRERLKAADVELTAMTLSLEEQRKRAEETLTLLAAAEAARDRPGESTEQQSSEAERLAALLSTARTELARQEEISADDQRRLTLLNQQVASLTAKLGSLQSLLDTAGEEQEDAELRVADLGQQLNAALLRTAEEKERRLVLEEKARKKAEEEVRDLSRYRSEFFARISKVLSGREGIKVSGDRFVFQSEVLFPLGQAALSASGRAEIANLATLLSDIADEIPPEIDWIIRVDGHTDSTPLSGTGQYRDNWELSQARSLAVVRFLTDELGFPAERLAAAGFSDTRPVTDGTTPEERALNRRIEMKLTEH